MRQLAVTADDFGLYRDLDPGIMEVCEEGVVTHVSLVANGENTDNAAAFLRNHPQTSVGIHLNITEGKPLSDPTNLKPILKDGNFFGLGKHGKVGFVILRRPSLAKAVEQEYRAQIERVRSLGLRISQLNAHGHLHLHPCLLGTVMKLALRYKIPFVRGVEEWASPRFLIRSRQRWGITIFLSSLTLKARVCSLPAKKVVLNRSKGVLDSGSLTRMERLSQILSHLPDGFTELFCHPGTSSERLRKNNPENYHWDEERALLISNQTKEFIQRSGIQLVNFSNPKDASV